MTIERFAGISVPNWMGPLPGGGYKGLTDELDALVARAAELLVAEYGRDVVIRFNSDRRSGGAWLKDAATSDALVGLCAGLRKVEPEGMTNDEVYDKMRADRRWYDALPDWIEIDTNVKGQALRDPSLANRDGTNPYAYISHASLEEGMDWLRANAVVPA
jgi:hypothetical protein